MNRLRREGWQTCLPVVIAPEQPLVFRAWAPGDALVPGVWDIPIPPETAPEVLPDVLLVPMLAFDAGATAWAMAAASMTARWKSSVH